MKNYLSLTQVAEKLGLPKETVAKYNLPTPDAMIGEARGWKPLTIETWANFRPGKGNRTYLLDGEAKNIAYLANQVGAFFEMDIQEANYLEEGETERHRVRVFFTEHNGKTVIGYGVGDDADQIFLSCVDDYAAETEKNLKEGKEKTLLNNCADQLESFEYDLVFAKENDQIVVKSIEGYVSTKRFASPVYVADFALRSVAAFID